MKGLQVLNVVAAVALCVGLTGAQVVRTQSGQALDANYRVGDSRFNTAVPPPVSLNGQLYITGQVTGPGRFRGTVPYTPANELGLNLPSAQLSTFRQESVGLPQVLGGSPYRATPYYEPSRTIFNVRAIAAGLTAPGSSVPISPTISPLLLRRLRTDVMADYAPVAEQLPGRSVSIVSPAVSPLAVTKPGPRTAAEGVSRVGATAMFAVMRVQDRQQLVREIYDLQRRQEEPAIEGETETRVPEAIERAEPSRREQFETDLEAQRRGGPYRREGLIPLPGESPESIPQPDQDVYLDVLLRLREQREARRAAPELPSAEGETPGLPAPAPEESFGALQQPPETSLAPFAKLLPARGALVEVKPTEGLLVIHGLAGISPDLFNRHMAAGAEKLKAGQFYDASTEYELAVTIDPGNPLGRIALGLARFGAGEPLSASIQFRRALNLLPPLMETRLDFPAMLDEKALRAQLERVDARVGEGERVKAALAFLSAFVHHNLGEEQEAKSAALKLQSAAGDDALMHTYAAFVLTGQRPATKPVAPAKP